MPDPLFVASDGRRFATYREARDYDRCLRGLAAYLARRHTLPSVAIAGHLLDDFVITRREA